jgi:hypothetical protein
MLGTRFLPWDEEFDNARIFQHRHHPSLQGNNINLYPNPLIVPSLLRHRIGVQGFSALLIYSTNPTIYSRTRQILMMLSFSLVAVVFQALRPWDPSKSTDHVVLGICQSWLTSILPYLTLYHRDAEQSRISSTCNVRTSQAQCLLLSRPMSHNLTVHCRRRQGQCTAHSRTIQQRPQI